MVLHSPRGVSSGHLLAQVAGALSITWCSQDVNSSVPGGNLRGCDGGRAPRRRSARVEPRGRASCEESTRPHGISGAPPLPPSAGGDRQRLVYVPGRFLEGHRLPTAQGGANGVGGQLARTLIAELHVVAETVAGVPHRVTEPAQVIGARAVQRAHARRVIHGGSSPAAAPPIAHPPWPPGRRCRARWPAPVARARRALPPRPP